MTLRGSFLKQLPFLLRFQSYNFTNLKPHTVFLISIRIFNNEAEGPEVERVVPTQEDGKIETQPTLNCEKVLQIVINVNERPLFSKIIVTVNFVSFLAICLKGCRFSDFSLIFRLLVSRDFMINLDF